MTETFAPLLIKSKDPRLMFITSGTSSIDEATRGLPYTVAKPPAGWPKPKTFQFTGYRSSKAGLNMLMADFGRVFKEDGVKIWAISPGFLATGLGNRSSDNATITPEQLRKMGAQDPSLGGNFVKVCFTFDVRVYL
jgi:NAD(P)-dependent dehydrogenase (short-subunit alcohol dehydrogenase family)